MCWQDIITFPIAFGRSARTLSVDRRTQDIIVVWSLNGYHVFEQKITDI